jgi:hypothetical protein
VEGVAGYEVPVHADIPHQEVIFLDETDPISSPIIRQIVQSAAPLSFDRSRQRREAWPV